MQLLEKAHDNAQAGRGDLKRQLLRLSSRDPFHQPIKHFDYYNKHQSSNWANRVDNHEVVCDLYKWAMFWVYTEKVTLNFQYLAGIINFAFLEVNFMRHENDSY